MIKRILKFTGLTLLLLILVVVGGISWIAGTESGLQQALALGKKFAPGTLEWDEASGKMIGPLRVRGLHYSQPDGIDAALGAMDFDWQPSALLKANLTIDQLHLDGIEVRLAETEAAPAEEAPGEFELPDISLPVAINLNDIAIENVAIYPAGADTPIEITRIALVTNAAESDVNVEQFEVVAPQGEITLMGEVTTRDDYPMDLAMNWQADIGQAKPLVGEGTVTGSLAKLQIGQQVTGFANVKLAADVSEAIKAPSWDATIEASLPDAASLAPQLTGTPELMLSTSGTADDYQAQAKVNATTTDTGPVAIDLDVNGSTEQISIQSLVATLTDTGGEFSASGDVTFASLQSDLTGQWKDLSWPVNDQPTVTSSEGSFDVKGTLEEFAANLMTRVDGDAVPEGQWAMALKGSSTALDSLAVTGLTLDGEIDISGTAGWEEEPEWDIELVTKGINPGAQWAEFPGKIDINLSSEGVIKEQGPQLTAQINRIAGSFREQPLSGSGRLKLAGETLDIEALKVTHGTTALSADGRAAEKLAINFELGSTDLSPLLPDLSGAFSVKGTVSGTKEMPQISANGSADDVNYASNSVDQLEFSIDAGLAPEKVSTITLSSTGITAGGQQISDVALNADGTQADHRLALSTTTSQGNFSTDLTGGYQNDTWTGSLASLQLEDTQAGTWSLREPVAIVASAKKADAADLCLDNSDELGSLCVTANWLAEGESKVLANISGLSPGLADAYMPEGLVVSTALNGDITAVLGADGATSANAQLALDPGSVTLESEGEPIEIVIEKTTVDADWVDNNASVALAAAFTDLGTLNMDASIQDPANSGDLAGDLNIDFPKLTLISAFAPQIQQVTGTLQSNLTFGGNISAPVIEGELALRDFSGEIPETAMFIKDTQLSVNGTADGSLEIEGSSSSGDGDLQISGNVNPSTRVLSLKIDGKSYQVANTAAMKVVVSPAMTIAMNDTGMQVKGEVNIPTVYINANGGNNGIKTVNASSDVVFASDEIEEEVPAQTSQVDVDVKVVLGDSVEIEAGDFRGRVEGDLRVQQKPGQAPRGTGTINVVNGDYVIYGQQLDMERGKILFGGGPVDNPTLDMQVARNVPQYEVVAGAKIQGTAQAPRLVLYSEPSMPDASILSYILLGQPPGSAGASYTLGTYLTPELYVSYGIGLFDAISTFNLRYKLTEKLALEAASGLNNSADLIYTIER